MTNKRHIKQKASDLVDKQLEVYRSMRDFSVTAEPEGTHDKKCAKETSKEPSNLQPRDGRSLYPFVIQKHSATHLHYDFRLGWNGVLKSWAVAKGPSCVPKDKRLAVQVEDHPIEYGGFEGIIPKGQYGGGTVLLWDTGTWEPQPGHTDVGAGLRDGALKLVLHGKKLKGKWALIRMGGKAANSRKPNWLLIKEHDSFERCENDPSITEESPESVVTGRSLEQIAQQKDHVWGLKVDASRTLPPAQKKSARERSVREARLRGAKKDAAKSPAKDIASCPKERIPKFVPPQLALQAKSPPENEGWLHELKLDGYRIQARKDGAKVSLLTRTGLDWTPRMEDIAFEIGKLSAETAIIDGEVVVLSADGTTSFAGLQASFREGERHPLIYFAFDLLHLDGRDLRGLELIRRKNILADLIAPIGGTKKTVQLSEHIETNGQPVFENACALHAEGIISKQVSGKYVSGRSRGWLKIKCSYEQEFVVGGFTLPSSAVHGVGALLLGYYDGHGKLIYAGRTGTGFTQKTHRSLRDRLDSLHTSASGFKNVPPSFRRGAIWVKPTLVAQVSFATWTADNLVRQAAFKGLREDKPARDVRREGPFDESNKRVRNASHKAHASAAAKSVRPVASAAGATKGVRIEHAAVRLTHPDKILDPESQLTKQQLADYYWAIAEHMLPQIANRPLSLVRCPEGSTKPCFFQKHTNSTLPPEIETIEVPDKKTGKLEPYITLSTRESLAGLAQMGVLELHPWGSQNDDLEHPDRIVIDLDPDESVSWLTLTEAAKDTRILFKKLGLESFLKSTGGKGLHVVVPVVPGHDWTEIKKFAHAIALALERRSPQLYLAKMSKAARKGKIFVDYLRNERGATSVAAFSPRARAGVTVSVPLAWSELKLSEMPTFHVADFGSWKQRLKRDPWKGLPTTAQHLDLKKDSQLLSLR